MRKPRVVFAGHSINSDYIADLLDLVKDRSVAVNIISKSGTTTEPGVAFRVIRQFMESRYGKSEAASGLSLLPILKKALFVNWQQRRGMLLLKFPLMWVEGSRC
jgi:glucose-6-phosphate isomerase